MFRAWSLHRELGRLKASDFGCWGFWPCGGAWCVQAVQAFPTVHLLGGRVASSIPTLLQSPYPNLITSRGTSAVGFEVVLKRNLHAPLVGVLEGMEVRDSGECRVSASLQRSRRIGSSGLKWAHWACNGFTR